MMMQNSFGILFLSDVKPQISQTFQMIQMGGQGTVASKLNFFLPLPFCLIKNSLFSNPQSMAKILYGNVEMTNFSSIMKRCSSIFLGKNS